MKAAIEINKKEPKQSYDCFGFFGMIG